VRYQLRIVTKGGQILAMEDERFSYLEKEANNYKDCRRWEITEGDQVRLEHINLSKEIPL
jgi:hypothetical protein